MAYEVTATRRRPQAFDALAGQEFVAETLKNTIESKKIAHAYLFSGPRGCGKTSTARILAKALNCGNGPSATPCGKCSHCIEISKGISPDVIEIDGASNTSVNDVRQIKEEVLFPPQSSRYKIYIIDEVHMLSTSAFNALLKTIEEPPEYAVFIFATTELQKVPATIKSRCQQFNFRLVPIDTVEKLLADAAAEIGIKADEEALYWVARESTGSVRDAYTLFDQVAAFSGDHITFEKIRDKLGLVGVDSLNVIFEDCASGRSREALLKLDEFLQNGISIEQFIANSTDYLRSILLIKNGITKESLLGQSHERFSMTVLNSWNPIQIERAISIFLQLYKDIRFSLSPRYELELAVSRLSWLSEYVSPVEVKVAIDQARNILLGSQAAMQQSSRPVQGAQNGANLAFLMNPTAWQQNPTPRTQAVPPQPLKPSKPLPVLDALKNLPEYRNATSVTENAASAPNPSPENPDQPAPNPIPPASQNSAQPTNQFPPASQNFAQSTNSVPPASQNFAQPTNSVPPASQNSAQPTNPVPPASQNFAQSTNPVQGEWGSAAAAVEIGRGEDFEKIPEDRIQKFVIDALSVRDEILAALFMNTRAWKKSPGKVTFEVGSEFDRVSFASSRNKILDAFGKIFSAPVDFEAVLRKVEVVDLSENAPPAVKLLCETFRGSVVGVTDSAGEQVPAASEPAQNAESARGEEADSGFEEEFAPEDIMPDDD
ncbi:DNA polymerase III subunit gamma/tau [Treponema saccharophilum]|uniref:DNA polymerase III subunit gamma/tau n=1 Tax=Treponema saccharophilum DSM 2985 TaxID=907348 RepID=H7EIP5_9SPIR|nr:DNA polymerase III subunit gamma/tau [Treponema saccharophilum]EIC02573.1 DNA polymerase III, subunits gamma and tau [Treponema saccharophilum DSM 2985]